MGHIQGLSLHSVLRASLRLPFVPDLYSSLLFLLLLKASFEKRLLFWQCGFIHLLNKIFECVLCIRHCARESGVGKPVCCYGLVGNTGLMTESHKQRHKHKVRRVLWGKRALPHESTHGGYHLAWASWAESWQMDSS